ncbi:bifunctional tryptophan synthase trp1 [Kappamyces sp. JEL0829]|nr:bifunctional tryptophan synthase trp1 [Kappamyces sp. JEL0829]
MTTLLVDNFDSFTWNVYQALCENGAKVVVKRNNEISLNEAIALQPKNLVISPGPGYPSSAGISNDLIRHFGGKIPVLGVCLGEQCMFEIFGGKVVPCGELIHGKVVLKLADPYHSLAGDLSTLPATLLVSAWTESGIVMGVRHKTFVMEGVQFHPESIASEQGQRIFANFLSWSGGIWDELSIDAAFLKSTLAPKEPESVGSLTGGVGKGIPLALASKMNSTARTALPSDVKEGSILHTIFKKRKLDISQEKIQVGASMEYLERCFALGLAPPLVSFRARLEESIAKHQTAVIAEIKRASPSKGDIDGLVHAPQQALAYAKGGAAAISVLTEPTWFKGDLADLANVRKALDCHHPQRPAVLRKEFIFDPYQILQARLAGADTVLLIVAMLEDATIAELVRYSRNLGMEPLVEVASSSEMRRALDLGATIIGVNNRDLNTFTVDMNRTTALSGLVTDSKVILLALSGITCRADVENYLATGAKGVLVGEALMKSPDKAAGVLALLGMAASSTSGDTAMSDGKPLVKICGLTTVDDALHAKRSGADLLGLIFAPESPRRITTAAARTISDAVRDSPETPLRVDRFKVPPVSAKDWFSAQTLPHGRPLVVGVFTSQTCQEINDIAQACQLDLIQLHTPKPPSFHRLLNRPVIQVLGINPSTGVEGIKQQARQYAGSCMAILLDTTTKDLVGGTGTTFDWSIIASLDFPVWMAGGLTPENVVLAAKMGPVVVDVSSGVEASKGVKDHSKVASFVANIKK